MQLTYYAILLILLIDGGLAKIALGDNWFTQIMWSIVLLGTIYATYLTIRYGRRSI